MTFKAGVDGYDVRDRDDLVTAALPCAYELLAELQEMERGSDG